MSGFIVVCLIVGLANIWGGRFLGRTASPPDVWIDNDQGGYEVSGQHQAAMLGWLLMLGGAGIVILGLALLFV